MSLATKQPLRVSRTATCALASARLGVVAGATAGAVAPAWAQSNTQVVSTSVGELNPMMVTVSRSEQPLSDALPHMTVISRTDIERLQAPNAVTLPRREAGIEIAQSGGSGTSASLFMRGVGSNQTLVLTDGVHVASGTSGGAQIAQLIADQTDHIEVVHDNVSTLYSSDAIGGVVQIFTRNGRGHSPLANAEIEYGACNTKRTQAGINGSLGENGDTSFAVSVLEFKTNGFSTINPQQAPKASPNDNPYTSKSVSVQLSHHFSADWQAGLTHSQTRGDVSYDNVFGKPTDDNTVRNVVCLISAYVDSKVTQGQKTRLTLSRGNDRSLNYTNGVLQVPTRFNIRSQTTGWQNNWAFMPDQLPEVGLEHLQTSVDSDAYNVPTCNVDFGYTGYEGKFGPHQLQLNPRRDRYSGFGGADSYYAGYDFAFNPQWKAVASVGSAFHASSFSGLYYPFFGNPSVQPEETRSVEDGVEYSGAIGLVRVMVFETDYSNLIMAVYDADFSCSVANVNRACVNGLETSYRGSIYGVDLRASFIMQNPQDLLVNQLFSRHTQHSGSVSAYRTSGPFSAGVEWNTAGDRQDPTKTLGGYGLLNPVGRYQITPDWVASARAENATNKNYQLIYPYNTASRGVLLTPSWQQHELER